MNINHRQYANGTGYCTAEGISEDKPLEVEALDKLDAIIGWITESYERSTQCQN